MKIKSKEINIENIIKNTSYSILNYNPYCFSYEKISETLFIGVKKNNYNNLICFYNPDTINEVKRIGKIFFNKLNLSDKPLISTKKNEMKFVDLNIWGQHNYKTNNILKEYRKNIIFTPDNRADIEKELMNYLQKNGLPIMDEFSASESEDNPNIIAYTFDTLDFITLCVIIYVLNEVSTIVFSSLGIIQDEKELSINYENDNIKSIFNFLPFFNIKVSNKFYIKDFMDNFNYLVNILDNSISYLEPKTYLFFDSNSKSNYCFKSFDNVIAIAWNILKDNLYSKYDEEKYTRKCKCGEYFEVDETSSTRLCQKCSEKQKNINSNNYYRNSKKLYNNFCNLYFSKQVALDRLNKSDRELIENIKKSKNFKNLKGKNKKENLKKAINILDTLVIN